MTFQTGTYALGIRPTELARKYIPISNLLDHWITLTVTVGSSRNLCLIQCLKFEWIGTGSLDQRTTPFQLTITLSCSATFNGSAVRGRYIFKEKKSLTGRIPSPAYTTAYGAAGRSVAAYFLGLNVEARGPEATAIGSNAQAGGLNTRGILPAPGRFAVHEDRWEHLAVAALASVIAEARCCGRKLEVREAITTAVHSFPVDKIKPLPLTRLYYEAEALVEYRWSDIEAVALRLLQEEAV